MDKSFKVILSNNSLLVIPMVTSPAVPGSFLALAFAIGLCLNALLVFTIASSSSLWRVRLNALLLQLGLVCGLECVLNISASVAFVTALERLSRNYGVQTQTICRVNVAFSHFTVTLQAVTLAALAIERALALHQRQTPPPATTVPPTLTSAPKSGAPTARLANLLFKSFPLLSWLYCAGLLVPIVASVQLVPVRPFSERYSCGLFMGRTSSSGSDVYTGVLAVLAALLPWAVMIAAVISALWRLAVERRRRLLLEEAAQQRARGDSSIWATGGSNRDTSWPLAFLDDAVYYVIVGIIIVLYIALVVPQTISIYVRSLTAANTQMKPRVSYTNSSGPSTESPIPPDLTPIATGTYDEIFIWCRYLFSILVPIVVFTLNRELRKKCQYFFCCCCCCCCRSNSITHLTESRSASALLQKQAHKLSNWPSIYRNGKYKKHLSKYGRIANYRTPVLFTTSQGLHLRLVMDNMKLNKKGEYNSQPNFVCDFCDVAINAAASFDSMNTARLSKGGNKTVPKHPPRFGHDGAFEQDMHLSDHSNDGKFHEMYVGSNKEIEKNSRETNMKKVRFANSINEISRTSKDSLKYSSDISLENLWPAYHVKPSKQSYKSFGSKASLLDDSCNTYY